MESLKSHLDIAQTAVDCLHEVLPIPTKCMRTEVTDGFVLLLFELVRETQKVVMKQRETIQPTVETDLDDVDAFSVLNSTNLVVGNHSRSIHKNN